MFEKDSQRSSFSRYALGAKVALIILIGLFGALGLFVFLPLVPCPQEDHSSSSGEHPDRPCYLCIGKGKISCLEFSRRGSGPLPYWEAKRIKQVNWLGFKKTTPFTVFWAKHLHSGASIRSADIASARDFLRESGEYHSINVDVTDDVTDPTQIILSIQVVER